MWLQWILAFKVRSRGRSPLGINSVARQRFVVLPTDIDLLGHMNNGRYPSYMDLARVDWTIRTGMQEAFAAEHIYAVVGQSTLVYRKSLALWQQFDIETALMGVDERAAYIQQRFVVDGEVYARGVMQGRFLRKGAGSVTIEELRRVLKAAGIRDELPPVSERISAWANGNRLPSTRATAPSEWDGRVPS